jgi:RimJ/RimL family protein N-acetyltransferase
VIRGHRVTLREIQERDYPLILEWQNDPDVWWLMDYERHFTLEDIVEDAARSEREGHPFVIEAEARAIGRIGLNRCRERDRICSLYLFIGDHGAWGKGYGPDAVMALVGWGFATFGLHQIELWSLAPNERAIRVYERCGFVREATLRERSFKDGEWVDRIVMSVQPGEYAAAREAHDARYQRER